MNLQVIADAAAELDGLSLQTGSLAEQLRALAIVAKALAEAERWTLAFPTATQPFELVIWPAKGQPLRGATRQVTPAARAPRARPTRVRGRRR